VGNAKGLFVSIDLSSGRERRLQLGEVVGPNQAQATVQTNTVPNTIMAPELGPIWLTFLSSCILAKADPNRFPPPTLLNVAGGCPVPPFREYYQRSSWRTDDETGLPLTFYSVDSEAFQKGVSGDHVVPLSRYLPPFDHGVTNITFQVLEQTNVFGLSLPVKAVLNVFWIEQNKREKIHEFKIEATRFDQLPSSTILAPTLPGIALVSDARGCDSGHPIVIEYVATNRFLETAELAQLTENEGVFRHTLTLTQPRARSDRAGKALFWAGSALVSVAFAVLLSFARQPKTDSAKITPKQEST
jgi:hypothetical protein